MNNIKKIIQIRSYDFELYSALTENWKPFIFNFRAKDGFGNGYKYEYGNRKGDGYGDGYGAPPFLTKFGTGPGFGFGYGYRKGNGSEYENGTGYGYGTQLRF